MSKNDLVVVTGAGGFIGGHLVKVLQKRGHTKIRAVDVKPLNEWYQKHPGVENQVGDLALLEPCRAAAKGAKMIYNLAADMGGMGFIETHKAECMLSVLISTHMLVAAKEAGTERFFYSSSACVYNGDKQTDANVTALKEAEAQIREQARQLEVQQATLQDTNDFALANLQRDGSYSVVPRIPGGEIRPEQLIVLGEVARDFDLYTKITGGQRIDMLGVKKEDLPAVWADLNRAGLVSGHAYGKALRTVKSCVGSTWCRYGVQDSVTMAVHIENRYRGLRAPHKLKMAVSGCTRELVVIPGASHLFPEPGAIDAVARLAKDWFVRHLNGGGSGNEQCGSHG